jgi:chromosomal replication initiator protein
MTCPSQVWDGVRRRLAEQLAPLAFQAWIEPLRIEPAAGGLRILCPSPFHRDRVRERHLGYIGACLAEELGERVPIELILGESTDALRRASAVAPAPRAEGAGRAPEARPICAPADPAAQMPRQEVLPHSFETFVVGPANALAREACLALARGRQVALSPLYLAAPSGLGKTHLARAVVAEAQSRGGNPVYVPAEQFTNELMSSIRSQRTAEFKRRYRESCELLVIEDVHFLRGKRATQLELFHTLEYLARVDRRVLLTAERMPREIADLDPCLVSRMCGGLCVEIEPPDAGLRREILRAKAARGGVGLPPDCLDRLVEATPGSVRDLESVLIQLVASASLLDCSIDLELTEQALRKVRPASEAGVRPDHVVETVAAFFQTTPGALAARTRRRDVLVPRQLAMYLCTRYTNASSKHIGRLFGRNHTAVANAVQVVERAILERAPLRYQVEALAHRVRGGREDAAPPRLAARVTRPSSS